MPVKIRLQRKGKKGQPFYHIVIADGRAPRDGKFIERIGSYNPLRKPAEINIDFDKTIQWLDNGAQPTDTVRAILSYKGILYKSHLLKGVSKGALSMDQAEAKFQIWLQEKEAKIASKVKEGTLSKKDALKKKLDAEKKVNDDRAKELAKKRLQMVEKAESRQEISEPEIQAEAAPEVSEGKAE